MEKRNIIKILSFIGTILIIFIIDFYIFSNTNNEKKKEEKEVSFNLEKNIEEPQEYTEENTREETSSETEENQETVFEETIMTDTTIPVQEETEIIPDILEINKVMYGISSGNIRQGASTNYATVGRISYGQKIEVTGKSGEWYRINYNTQEAYIHESLLSENQPQQLQSQQPQTQQPQSAQSQQPQPQLPQPEQQEPVQKPTSNADSTFVDEVIRLVNIERNNEGLLSLSKNITLCQAAQTRASEIITVFDHFRPDGTSCFTVAEDYNIAWTAIGENIAMGQRTPQEVVKEWMDSPGHRANILNGNYNQIGVGVVQSGGYYYWVQLFIRALK